MGVRRWREMVIDREKWNVIFRQAKAQWAVVPMEEEEELYVWQLCATIIILELSIVLL